MIREDIFVQKMTDHWQALGNCTSQGLQALWRLSCKTFNEQIINGDDRWRVLQPATGTGKSQGLALYSALMKDQPNIGILIVVRLIDQADDIVKTINRLANQVIAKAHHTENKLSTDEMADTQVLVITHKAYELSLERHLYGSNERFTTFQTYSHCFERKRQLVVIDECLDIVRQYQVSLDDMNWLLGMVPPSLQYGNTFKEQFLLLTSLRDTLLQLYNEGGNKSLMVRTLPENLHGDVDLNELREALVHLDWDLVALGQESLRDRSRIADRIDKTLQAAEATLVQWRYYSKQGKIHTLNTANLIMPDEIQGAVILDATASQNLLYKLLGDKAELKPVPTVRNYSNVTLHVAIVQGAGKGKMLKNVEKRTAILMDDLINRLPGTAKAFICAHKDVEHHLQKYDTPFELKTGHWGAIDGRNDFQHCDTFVGFGLPYRSKVNANNVYMAIKGPQDSDWLNSAQHRASEGSPDVLREILQGQLASDMIQAINRIRVRRVIDNEGNCDQANCYLVIGKDRHGQSLLDNIKKAMPGIRLKHWNLTFSEPVAMSVRAHRSEYVRSLHIFLANRGPGKWSATFLKDALGIPTEKWKALIKQIKSEGSNLNSKLKEIGCYVISEGNGRGARTYILKD